MALLSSGLAFLPTKVFASTIVLAASNSSSGDKTTAGSGHVCSGTGDHDLINSFLTSGNTVELLAGTYNTNGQILPESNTTLYGQGNTTIINYGSGYDSDMMLYNVSNVNIHDLEIEGTLLHAALYIYSYNATNVSQVKQLGMVLLKDGVMVKGIESRCTFVEIAGINSGVTDE